VPDMATKEREVDAVADNRPFEPKNDLSSCDRSCDALMKRLRKVDFSIYDTVLYLDVYPTCTKALEYYHKLIAEREELCNKINSSCGPITVNNVKPGGKWSWTKGPWPWECDAN